MEGSPGKRKRAKADIRPELIKYCRDPDRVAWTACGFCPAVSGLFVLGGMSELFRVGFSDCVARGEATGRWLIAVFVERINAALAAGSKFVVLSFDCAPPAEKWQEQVSRTIKADAPPLKWDGVSQLLHLDRPLPPWDSLMANRKARFRMISDLMMELSQPAARDRIALYDDGSDCAVYLDYHARLVELRHSSYCNYHPSTQLTEDDFGLHYWARRLRGQFEGDCVCLNSDTDCLTACLLIDPEPRRRMVLIGAVDHVTKGTDFVKFKHTDATALREQLLEAFPGRTAAELGLALICGGGDYVSSLPQCSYRNLLRALKAMDPESLPLCSVDPATGALDTLNTRSLEVLVCEALALRINDACKKGNAVSVNSDATDPMGVMLRDLHAYGRKTYTQAINTLYCEFPRHASNVEWYAKYVKCSILGVPTPDGLECGGWVLDDEGHYVYPPCDPARLSAVRGA